MKTKPVSNALVVLCLLLFTAGCAGRGKAAEPVFLGKPGESPKAKVTPPPPHVTVSAASTEEGPFRHPLAINEAKLEGLLRSITFQKSATFRWENPERMLTDAEATALAHRIVVAFASLRPHEMLRFVITGDKAGETRGELFVTKGYLNLRVLTIQGHKFLSKGPKATSHEWKLVPQVGQGFFPSRAVVWNQKEETNWILVKISELSSSASDPEGSPDKQPLKDRIHVFP